MAAIASSPPVVDTAVLARRLGADHVEDLTVTPVDHPHETITTGGRWWVTGTVRHATAARPLRLFLKLTRTARRSPLLRDVPPEMHDDVVATLPWRVEADVYESGLADHLPQGCAMPRAIAVDQTDAESALIWLPAVGAREGSWTPDDWHTAARTLGRIAGSAAVAEVAEQVGHPSAVHQARIYWEGRITHQFVAAYRDDDLWRHPVLARHVDAGLRDRLLALVHAAPRLVAEIEALPLLSGHGDASPNNILPTDDGPVLIDWGFFGRHRVGFDLGQLVMSRVDAGDAPADELPALRSRCLQSYREGLRDMGVHIDRSALARAHAVQVAISHGLPAVPLDRLGDDAATLDPLVRERARALDGILSDVGL